MIDNTTKIEKTITFTDNYFVPENQPFNGVIEISDIEEDEKGALLELLYSFEKPDIISTEGNYIIRNKVTLIEYNPQEEKKTIQIFIESNEAYYLYAYGGPSQGYYSYYSPEQYITIKNHPIYAIKLDDPLKDFNLDEDIEKYYITLIIERSREKQEIKLSVKYYSNPLDDLYELVDESYIDTVVSNFSYLLENNYVYYHIAQNPPGPYNHTPIDLKEALNNIDKTNRKFYDFYRDLKEVIATPEDLHLSINGISTPKGFNFQYMVACLPFSYYVEKKTEEAPKLYIKYFSDCANYFSEKVKKYVNDKADNKIALEQINGQDPFDYIQNFGKPYVALRNPHAQFSNEVHTPQYMSNLHYF